MYKNESFSKSETLSCVSSLTFMELIRGLSSLFWICSTLVLHSTPSTMRSYSNISSSLLAYQVTCSRSRPPDFGQEGCCRGSRKSWTDREILFYLIMYRKYVRKW